MPTVLIIGGAGFIGFHVGKYLSLNGYKVISVDILPYPKIDVNEYSIEHHQIDINQTNDLRPIIKNCQWVIYSAVSFMEDKVVQPLELILKICVEVGITSMIFYSSNAVFGMVEQLHVTEEMPVSPNEFYGMQKVQAEKICEKYSAKMKIIILRLPCVIGANRPSVFVPFFKLILHGLPLPIIGKGKHLFQLMDVEDVARVTEFVLINKMLFSLYHVGTQTDCCFLDSWKQIIKLANSLDGRWFSRFRVPVHIPLVIFNFFSKLFTSMGWTFGNRWLVEMIDKNNVMCTKRIGEEGWKPYYSSSEAFQRYFLWCKNTTANNKFYLGQRGQSLKLKAKTDKQLTGVQQKQ